MRGVAIAKVHFLRNRARHGVEAIRPLYNIEPPATETEMRAAALQFVRKISGYNVPSKANAEAFTRAVDEVAGAAARLLASLETSVPPRDREVEAEKARERARVRYGRVS